MLFIIFLKVVWDFLSAGSDMCVIIIIYYV